MPSWASGRRDATAADIRAALALYRRADALLIVLVGDCSRSSRELEQAVEIEVGGDMGGEAVERRLDERVMGDRRSARRRAA